jgi:hypothetical protein
VTKKNNPDHAPPVVPAVKLTRKPEWDVFANQVVAELGAQARCGPSLCDALNLVKGCVGPDCLPWNVASLHQVMEELIYDRHVCTWDDHHQHGDVLVMVHVYEYARPTTSADLTSRRDAWEAWGGRVGRGWFGVY